MKAYLKINEKDNVAVALRDLTVGEMICLNDAESITLCDDIPQGHKFAFTHIRAGSTVIKYGFPIGKAKSDIASGCHVHTHNLSSALSPDGEYQYRKNAAGSLSIAEATEKIKDLPSSFSGYVRSNGSVGIRNEIWIIPTVGCVNDVAMRLMMLAKSQFNTCDGIGDIIAFRHPYGCSQLGEDQENTRKILADLCMHPNAGGVLLLGLGCENSGIAEIQNYLSRDKNEIRFLVCQDTSDEIEDGLKLIAELVAHASSVKRTPCELSRLTVGVKCGGSDGLSGITANPLVGKFTDLLTSAGGSVLMSEVPEMFGAENALLSRCASHEIFERGVEMIQNFKNYFASYNQPVYENPSPGNKAGGITTLEEKSLGCVQKAGSTEIQDILAYAERKKTAGLSLLSAPGNDLVSSTALAAAGAQLILFTTGRGTPFSAPVPTLKISSNSNLYAKKQNWIDFDAGFLTDGGTFSDMSAELFRFVLDAASGNPSKSERSGYRDMAIFKQNVTL